MNPHQPLIDDLYREEILRARRQSPAMRFSACLEITDFALSIMRSAVRCQFPEATPSELVQHGRERIAKVRRIDELRRYRPAEV